MSTYFSIFMRIFAPVSIIFLRVTKINTKTCMQCFTTLSLLPAYVAVNRKIKVLSTLWNCAVLQFAWRGEEFFLPFKFLKNVYVSFSTLYLGKQTKK